MSSSISLPIARTTFLRNLNVEKLLQDKIDKRKSTNATTRFPVKLYTMLSNAKEGNYEHIVSWNLDGLSFKIHDKELFVKNIMPEFTTQTKFRSFQKQLNLYGFERLTICSKPMIGSYYHPDFQRGKEELCKTITRPSTAKEAKTLKQVSLKKSAQQQQQQQKKVEARHRTGCRLLLSRHCQRHCQHQQRQEL